MKIKSHITILRFIQIGIACIPFFIGLFVFINGVSNFSVDVSSTVVPLITMENFQEQSWRALPASFGPIIYTLVLMSQVLVAIFAMIGVVKLLLAIKKDGKDFDHAKIWTYIACGWGIMLWGLIFFEVGGDWFMSNIKTFQVGSLSYVLMFYITFAFLSLSID
jgi:predicted small integral membrane protein